MKFVILTCLLLAAFKQQLNAQVYSIKKPASARNDTISGHKAWTNISGINSSGNYGITSTPTLLGQYTTDLIVTGFNFSIPSNATITGISVTIQKGASGLLNDVTDSAVRLVVNGAIKGSNLASAVQWGSSTTTTYGSSTQTWGLSWKAATMNATNFGVAISAKLGGISVLPVATINSIQVEVYYSVALPVELLDFTVTPQNGEALLNWITDMEINNNLFAIERSGDGDTFTQISEVNGAGNSTRQHAYSWVDGHPLNGESYYRLKQVDYNGNLQYSDIQPFSSAEKIKPYLSVYPNPVIRGQDLYVEPSNTDEEILDLYDVYGRLITTTNIIDRPLVNTRQLPLGTFIARVRSASGCGQSCKVVVTEH